MNLVAARQKLTASNIANVDTPGYKTKDVEFTSVLQDVSTGSANQQPATAAEVPNLPGKPDGNNVSLDREARNLAENALRFHIAGQLVQSQIRLTRSAMQEVR